MGNLYGWMGTRIRKGGKEGKVVYDVNGVYRTLGVKFEDDTTEEIVMNNVGSDPEYIHQYEWFRRMTNKWHRF